MKLYSIKNIQTGKFNPPFVARDHDDAMEIVRKAIISGRDISLLVELENLVLYDVGSFGATDGILVSEGWCPRSIVCLDEIALPEHVKELIAKLKKVEADVDKNGIKSFFYKLLAKCDEKKVSNKKKKIDKEDEVKENQ